MLNIKDRLAIQQTGATSPATLKHSSPVLQDLGGTQATVPPGLGLVLQLAGLGLDLNCDLQLAVLVMMGKLNIVFCISLSNFNKSITK